MGAEKSLFTESESSSSPKRHVKKYTITHTHRVKLQHELHDISVYYNCSRPHGTFFLFQRASCWFVAIHDKKSEGNVRCSGFVCHSISIIKKKKKKKILTMKVTFPLILYGKSLELHTWSFFFLILYLWWSVSLISERDTKGIFSED